MGTNKKYNFFKYLTSHQGSRLSLTYIEERRRGRSSKSLLMGRLLNSGPVREDEEKDIGRVVGVRLRVQPGYFFDEGTGVVRAQMDWVEDGDIVEGNYGPFINIKQQTSTMFSGPKDAKVEDADPEDVQRQAIPTTWLLTGDQSKADCRKLQIVFLV